ncbi:hypothetical protein M378DRAFT_15111 [Amanita muscaria Koide BX008]|uniref:Uncharacterized protein n=1 Tax=Amanita muscaria (strain Koide BX008) TaxID=946122 RepID=A0A0C2S8C0_AMAMK|nr:hypothetical protein M378DRAFT_15111 [Amanita muscaria Koide BX008]
MNRERDTFYAEDAALFEERRGAIGLMSSGLCVKVLSPTSVINVTALVAVKRGSASARGTENVGRSNGDVRTTTDESLFDAEVVEAAVALVLTFPNNLLRLRVQFDGGTVTEVVGGGVVEMVGLRIETPSVPNTLFVVLRLFA